MRAFEHQRSIFVRGASGQSPVIPADYKSLRDLARQSLTHRAFTYIDGGAGSGVTIRENTSEFDNYRIVPRMLHGIEEVDIRTTVFGVPIDSPVMAAPVGVLELAHPGADALVASACDETGTPMMISSQASQSMEYIMSQVSAVPVFYQLYWGKSDELARNFVERAERCGCRGIVVTLDTTVLAWRTRDLDAAYLPFTYARGIAQYTSDPVFQRLVDEGTYVSTATNQRVTLGSLRTFLAMARRYPGSTWKNLISGRALKGVRTFGGVFSNPGLSWRHIEKLKGWTDLPIILKGILSIKDAQRACEAGVDGIIVSNHGGRQIDGSIPSIALLQEIVQAASDKVDVVIDSGIRTGAHIFKCLALGARAIMVGRPYAFALAVGGEQGVVQCFNNLVSELELTMMLAGCRNIKTLTTDFIRQTHE